MTAKNPNNRWSSNEIVPLAERVRYMLFVRAALIVFILAGALMAPGLVGTLPKHAYAILGIWACVSLVIETIWRLSRSRGLPLFGASLIVDGMALVWLSEVGHVTNVRYLLFFHMVGVVLLASYRTGLKIVLWDSLLLFTVYFGQHAAVFGHSVGPGNVAKWDPGQLSVFIASLWLVAIATACFSSVNERELRRRRFDLEALARFASLLESATDREAVAATLLKSLSEAFPLGRLILLTVGRAPMFLGRWKLPAETSNPQQLDLDSVMLRAESTHQTILVSNFDTHTDPWLTRAMEGGRNFMVVPLHAEGGCVGVLVAEHDANRGSRVERRLVAIIERFASHTALALRNAALLEQAERMAHTDGLTHVANRRAFEVSLEREVARSIRSGQPFSVVMLDIDNFKLLNDTYGHQIGDDVLTQVASALQTGSRDFDTTARYGGEEFVVILPGCGPSEALISAHRLHRCVSEHAKSVPVTVSAGVASFPDHARTGEGLLKAADDALYMAKRAGRNRVLIAGSSGDVELAMSPAVS